MTKKLKSIPKFRSEAEERRFWEAHDSADYIDWTKAQRVRFPNLKPSTTAISSSTLRAPRRRVAAALTSSSTTRAPTLHSPSRPQSAQKSRTMMGLSALSR